MQIESLSKSNYPDVANIYQQGISTGIATFETKVPGWEDWDKSHLPYGRLVAVEGNTVLGWAALSPVSSRCVYGGVAEVSIYLAEQARGKGIGKQLLNALIAASEENGIWTLQAGVFPMNKASIALHEKCGFRMIGYKERIGQLNGQWIDNILLERRSKIVGI
ncbi:GNAT family N-acetyltransferase [Fulvivirga lutea]|uniref:N-acetyltransferase n=1 Tax=Fulvivirga lutea TaxID=2810512 RepID=A0A975A0A2_9BACT|nr:GNAT family N-acetyltransferase [Fulvivirga lutea]QSE96596.1 N-acetyltransferase [Fulvivirga lutea]